MDDHGDRIARFVAAMRPFNEALRPIIRSEEGSGGRRVEGTATLVGDGSHRFAITAAHCVDGSRGKYIGVRDRDAVPWPSKYSRLEPLVEGLPDADIAWARATVAPGETALDGALPAALSIAALDDAANGLYVAAGFPASKAKVRMGDGSANAKLMFAAVDLAPPERTAAIPLDARAQVAFTYSQERRVNAEGKPTVGAHPRGMSGGAVFLLSNLADPRDPPLFVPFLVGVLTQFHETPGVLVATRVRLLWASVGMQPPLGEQLYRRVDA